MDGRGAGGVEREPVTPTPARRTGAYSGTSTKPETAA